MTRTLCLAATIAATVICGCDVDHNRAAMPGADGGAMTSDGGPVTPDCRLDNARVDMDGDGWCPAGRDRDLDGFCCSADEALPPDDGDCNDDAATISPGATEQCSNGRDDDCGESPCGSASSCPNPDTVDPQCPGVMPACAAGLTRTCTTSCGSTTGVQTCSTSGTWGSCAALPSEICGNGQDDNCAGGVDEGCSVTTGCTPGAIQSCPTSCGSSGSQTCLSDRTWGACTPPTSEICGNGRDDNCAGGIDEGCSSSTLCTPGATVACPTSCGSSGSQTCAADGRSYGVCAAPESCGNSLDDDCDGIVNDGCATGCTVGTSQACVTSCGSSGSQTCVSGGTWGACGASESCNGRDDDCDGIVDDGCTRFYRDVDGDGYGRASDTVMAASAPAGYVAIDSDCDDARFDVNPGRSEICSNGRDDDCDGAVDEGCAVVTYYRDADGDGYGRNDVTVTTPTAGYTTISGDCNDSNASVHPGAADVCPSDGLDNDCSGGDMTACGASCTMTDTVVVRVGAASTGGYRLYTMFENGDCTRAYYESIDSSAAYEWSVTSGDGVRMFNIERLPASGEWFAYLRTATRYDRIFLRDWLGTIQLNGASCTLPTIPAEGYTPPATIAAGACEPCYDREGWPNVCINTSSTARELRCNDGVDNDGDGASDLSDVDCQRWRS